METSSQTLGWWIQNYGSIQDSRDFGGVVPAYPIFMFIGILIVIIASAIKMRMKKIPLNELYWAILIVVPIGIIGGTIFGKAFIPGETWYHVFFFWEPGMSLFGAIGLGTVAGFVWFYKRSKVTQISVWVYADCILPNVLLGQAIGRWGNMYNHEILGHAVSYESLQWLIPGIRDKLFYWPTELQNLTTIPGGWENVIQPKLSGWIIQNPTDLQIDRQAADLQNWLTIVEKDDLGTVIHTYIPNIDECKTLAKTLDGGITFREPLFLYESLANTFFWLILTFVVPNLSRWIQPKGRYPWDITPNAYPGWYNPKVKSLSLDDIKSWSVQRPIKYKKSADGKYTISLWESWNKAYYLYEPNEKVIDKFIKKQDERIDQEDKLLMDLSHLKEKHNSDIYRLNSTFARKTANFNKQDKRYIALNNELANDLKLTNVQYKANKKKLNKELGGWQRYFKPVPGSAELSKIENPNNYFVIRSGVLTGSYVFGYMIIRIILETHRRANELFVQNYWVPDFIVLAIILIAGLAIILIAQFISPYKYREVGWLYEKSY